MGNRITFTATMLFSEENINKAIQEVRNISNYFSENKNLEPLIKDNWGEECVACFDNVIKVYLPINFMGAEGAHIADTLMDLSYGYYMDKVFESNEYSRTAFYRGEGFRYDCFSEMFTSPEYEALLVAKEESVSIDYATSMIDRLSSEYHEAMDSGSSNHIEEMLSKLFLDISSYRNEFSDEDRTSIEENISELKKDLGLEEERDLYPDFAF
jgi:hypothetical protein